MEDIKRNPLEWIVYGEVGTSSKTIWAVMMGAVKLPVTPHDRFLHFSPPADPSDFRRCYNLLLLYPDWKKRLHEVADIFPEWKPMIEHWEDMEKLYFEELPSGSAPRLYDLMQQLREEGAK